MGKKTPPLNAFNGKKQPSVPRLIHLLSKEFLQTQDISIEHFPYVHQVVTIALSPSPMKFPFEQSSISAAILLRPSALISRSLPGVRYILLLSLKDYCTLPATTGAA
ncbi:MAG: hypothetical protein H6750_21485 [Nitrospiraceae bacterium]|nr:hypothetical protein [Nitrospira sp.]MCB9776885.1 hypothetical protein [Nitrospiraceae bacterium]MDR4487436.1 hypothetical protein [Nitrospirales bacterium]